MQIINPATEEIITTLQEDSAESLKNKLKTLQKGQKSWAKVNLKKRIAIIEKFLSLIHI